MQRLPSRGRRRGLMCSVAQQPVAADGRGPPLNRGVRPLNQLADDGYLTLASRVTRFLFLLVASWVVMTFTHEIRHIIGGTCCGGALKSADLLPWHLPYSIFEPDPFPLVTLWAGLIIGVLAPVAIAMILQREWMWFIANFCVLANGAYIATA